MRSSAGATAGSESAPAPAPSTSAGISGVGKALRLGAAGIVAVVTLAGTLYGEDSDFPFGPFRMYATRDDPDGVVRVVAVQTVDADGTVHDVTGASGAPRRAELEGRMAMLRADCTQFAALVPRYHPGAAATTVRLVEHAYVLQGGRRRLSDDDVVCTVSWSGSRGPSR